MGIAVARLRAPNRLTAADAEAFVSTGLLVGVGWVRADAEVVEDLEGYCEHVSGWLELDLVSGAVADLIGYGAYLDT